MSLVKSLVEKLGNCAENPIDACYLHQKISPVIQDAGDITMTLGLCAPRPSYFSTSLCREYKLFVKQLKYVKSTLVSSTHQNSLINRIIIHDLGSIVNATMGVGASINRGSISRMCLFLLR